MTRDNRHNNNLSRLAARSNRKYARRLGLPFVDFCPCGRLLAGFADGTAALRSSPDDSFHYQQCVRERHASRTICVAQTLEARPLTKSRPQHCNSIIDIELEILRVSVATHGPLERIDTKPARKHACIERVLTFA